MESPPGQKSGQDASGFTWGEYLEWLVRSLGSLTAVAEKLSAALRQGRRLVVIPAENASELGRLSELAAKLDIHPVRSLKEAVDLVLVEHAVETPDY